MYSIRLDFQTFHEVDLAELIDAIGVYVIWDAQAQARPTYIGEGRIIKRLADHVVRDDVRFAKPWDGYVAIITDSTDGVHKEEARAAERLLLDVASDTDRSPIINVQPGAASVVRRFCKNETLRLAIRGFDPFCPPREARPLDRVKQIKAWSLGSELDYDIAHDWRLRRLRKPIT